MSNQLDFKQQLDQLKSTIDIQAVAVNEGWSFYKKKSQAGLPAYKSPDGESWVQLGKDSSDGHYVWRDLINETGGSIVDWVYVHHMGITNPRSASKDDFKEALRTVKGYAGIELDTFQSQQMESNPIKEQSLEWKKKKTFNLQQAEFHQFLIDRKISRDIINDALIKGRFGSQKETDDSFVYNDSLVFPFYDGKGNIITLERKNRFNDDAYRLIIEEAEKDGDTPERQNISRFSSGGSKSGFWMSNPPSKVNYIGLFEQPIDAMSFYQMNIDKLRDRVLLLASGGNLIANQIDLLDEIIDKEKPHKVLLGNDIDHAGLKYNLNFIGTSKLGDDRFSVKTQSRVVKKDGSFIMSSTFVFKSSNDIQEVLTKLASVKDRMSNNENGLFESSYHLIKNTSRAGAEVSFEFPYTEENAKLFQEYLVDVKGLKDDVTIISPTDGYLDWNDELREKKAAIEEHTEQFSKVRSQLLGGSYVTNSRIKRFNYNSKFRVQDSKVYFESLQIGTIDKAGKFNYLQGINIGAAYKNELKMMLDTIRAIPDEDFNMFLNRGLNVSRDEENKNVFNLYYKGALVAQFDGVDNSMTPEMDAMDKFPDDHEVWAGLDALKATLRGSKEGQAVTHYFAMNLSGDIELIREEFKQGEGKKTIPLARFNSEFISTFKHEDRAFAPIISIAQEYLLDRSIKNDMYRRATRNAKFQLVGRKVNIGNLNVGSIDDNGKFVEEEFDPGDLDKRVDSVDWFWDELEEISSKGRKYFDNKEIETRTRVDKSGNVLFINDDNDHTRKFLFQLDEYGNIIMDKKPDDLDLAQKVLNAFDLPAEELDRFRDVIKPVKREFDHKIELVDGELIFHGPASDMVIGKADQENGIELFPDYANKMHSSLEAELIRIEKDLGLSEENKHFTNEQVKEDKMVIAVDTTSIPEPSSDKAIFVVSTADDANDNFKLGRWFDLEKYGSEADLRDDIFEYLEVLDQSAPLAEKREDFIVHKSHGIDNEIELGQPSPTISELPDPVRSEESVVPTFDVFKEVVTEDNVAQFAEQMVVDYSNHLLVDDEAIYLEDEGIKRQVASLSENKLVLNGEWKGDVDMFIYMKIVAFDKNVTLEIDGASQSSMTAKEEEIHNELASDETQRNIPFYEDHSYYYANGQGRDIIRDDRFKDHLVDLGDSLKINLHNDSNSFVVIQDNKVINGNNEHDIPFLPKALSNEVDKLVIAESPQELFSYYELNKETLKYDPNTHLISFSSLEPSDRQKRLIGNVPKIQGASEIELVGSDQFHNDMIALAEEKNWKEYGVEDIVTTSSSCVDFEAKAKAKEIYLQEIFDVGVLGTFKVNEIQEPNISLTQNGTLQFKLQLEDQVTGGMNMSRSGDSIQQSTQGHGVFVLETDVSPERTYILSSPEEALAFKTLNKTPDSNKNLIIGLSGNSDPSEIREVKRLINEKFWNRSQEVVLCNMNESISSEFKSYKPISIECEDKSYMQQLFNMRREMPADTKRYIEQDKKQESKQKKEVSVTTEYDKPRTVDKLKSVSQPVSPEESSQQKGISM